MNLLHRVVKLVPRPDLSEAAMVEEWIKLAQVTQAPSGTYIESYDDAASRGRLSRLLLQRLWMTLIVHAAQRRCAL